MFNTAEQVKDFEPRNKHEISALRFMYETVGSFIGNSNIIIYRRSIPCSKISFPDLKQYVKENQPGLTITDDYFEAMMHVLEFILFNDENLNKSNPYDPQNPDLVQLFEDRYSDKEKEIAHALRAYEIREELKAAFEWAITSTCNIEILGQVASGKTTFLHTIQKALNLDAVNIWIHSNEPDDDKDLYRSYIYDDPQGNIETQIMTDSRYSRESTRGPQATLGTEILELFAYAEKSQELSKIKIVSQGGHVRATHPIIKERATTAFFVDFRLMQQLAKLSIDTPIDTVLNNGETVIESILSLLLNIQTLKRLSGKVIGVVSKLPSGQNLSEDVLDLMETAYDRCLLYYQSHKKEIEEEILILSSFDQEYDIFEEIDIESETVPMPPHTKISTLTRMKYSPAAFRVAQEEITSLEEDTDFEPMIKKSRKHDLFSNILRWLTIYDDSPVFSGSIEVLQELLKIALTPDVQAIDFNTHATPGNTHYKDLLPHLIP